MRNWKIKLTWDEISTANDENDYDDDRNNGGSSRMIMQIGNVD